MLLKYNSAGVLQWVVTDDRSPTAWSVTVDSAGFVYSAGCCRDGFITTKLRQIVSVEEQGRSVFARSAPMVHPNPFRDHTVITYDAQGQIDAKLMVYDVTGRCVKKLVGGTSGEGSPKNVVQWDGRDDDGRVLPPGVYFCGIQCGSVVKPVKVLRLE